MARYIDADKIPYVESEDGVLDDFAYRYDINEIPTADVVEVVRCGKCVHYKTDTDYCKEHNKGYCEWDNTVKSRNHFCSYGERGVTMV